MSIRKQRKEAGHYGRRRISAAAGWLWLLLMAVLLTGCENALSRLPFLPSKEETEDGRTRYQIYYTNAEHTHLTSSAYEPQEQTFEGMLGEMLEKFEHPETMETEADSVIPDGVRINGYTIGVDSLLIDFSGSYISMSNVEEILLRAGIVKTLVQLPGIYSISLTVDGQPLAEPASGQVIGPMRDETFVDSPDDSINSYQFVSLNLLFPAYNGQKLVEEKREAFYSSNLIMERVIVDHLIKGPQTPGLQQLTAPTVQVNSVRVTDGICVIDLDQSFNQAWNEAISPQLCLYAFVNTITSACDVQGVAFRINGSADVRFRDEISLDQIFTADTQYLEQPEAAAADGEAADADTNDKANDSAEDSAEQAPAGDA